MSLALMSGRCHAAPMTNAAQTISIRVGTPDDELALMRLAQLDSSTVPLSPLLLAECDGVLRAALSLHDGRFIADPFAHTAELISLLGLRAARLKPTASLRSRVREALSIRRGARAFAA